MIIFFQGNPANAACIAPVTCQVKTFKASLAKTTFYVSSNEQKKFPLKLNYELDLKVDNPTKNQLQANTVVYLISFSGQSQDSLNFQIPPESQGNPAQPIKSFVTGQTITLGKGEYTATYSGTIFVNASSNYVGKIDLTGQQLKFVVQEVPEPMTILGSITALGFGASFKRKRD